MLTRETYVKAKDYVDTVYRESGFERTKPGRQVCDERDVAKEIGFNSMPVGDLLDLETFVVRYGAQLKDRESKANQIAYEYGKLSERPRIKDFIEGAGSVAVGAVLGNSVDRPIEGSILGLAAFVLLEIARHFEIKRFKRDNPYSIEAAIERLNEEYTVRFDGLVDRLANEKIRDEARLAQLVNL